MIRHSYGLLVNAYAVRDLTKSLIRPGYSHEEIQKKFYQDTIENSSIRDGFWYSALLVDRGGFNNRPPKNWDPPPPALTSKKLDVLSSSFEVLRFTEEVLQGTSQTDSGTLKI